MNTAVVPLSLSTSSSKQLLHPSELALCSRLRILPKPFLLIKECTLQEHVRRAALGQSLERAEMTSLFPSLGLVDEDVLEMDETGEQEEGRHERAAATAPDAAPLANLHDTKNHKIEAVWDFYFSHSPSTVGVRSDHHDELKDSLHGPSTHQIPS